MNCFERWSVWGTSIAVLVTGIVYGWMKYFMEPLDPWAAINHPLQPWVLKAHILTAPLLIFAIGMITIRHVWQHYRCRVPLGRRTGIVTALVTLPMILTGYLIQAITDQGWLTAMAISHIGFGLIYGAGLAFHQIVVHRKNRRNRARSTQRLPLRQAQAADPERAGVA